VHEEAAEVGEGSDPWKRQGGFAKQSVAADRSITELCLAMSEAGTQQDLRELWTLYHDHSDRHRLSSEEQHRVSGWHSRRMQQVSRLF
jgi:hypothetical protein